MRASVVKRDWPRGARGRAATLLAASIVVAAGSGARVHAQTATATVGHALTPGAVAVLVNTIGEAATQTRLMEALASDNEELRAIAARVARVSHLTGLVPRLEQALTAAAPGFGRDELVAAIDVLRDKVRPRADTKSLEITGDAPFVPEPAGAEGLRVRIWPWMSPTLARDLLRVTGCRLPRDAPFMVAILDYRPDGTINHGMLQADSLSAACKLAGRVLAALTVAPPRRAITPGAKEAVVMAFGSDFLTCVQDAFAPTSPDGAPGLPVPVSDVIKAPRKLKSVTPYYPPDAIEKRIQGVVLLQAQITPAGCIAHAEVLKSVHPQLDFAALRSVLDWRYTPTLVGGKPVPVIMTVTVNFALQP